ncbi:hypothetical protein B0T26DRAFT_349140 [Lasiosphaeria miniovina]|uniref:DUF6594 domain-containing protein n=1 Tax=Lasiosphaeria miniovina TaxID=1954250 RepID=A0AA40AC29_9PEZI|nr:uncharacterized protein B0T26DRAFT_349140 [Lasiosphaeria miniovina]KAK0712933.1 hypothetical protein B0T26DRAFT_349140 [Lasiosphaeria miniovina]
MLASDSDSSADTLTSSGRTGKERYREWQPSEQHQDGYNCKDASRFRSSKRNNAGQRTAMSLPKGDTPAIRRYSSRGSELVVAADNDEDRSTRAVDFNSDDADSVAPFCTRANPVALTPEISHTSTVGQPGGSSPPLLMQTAVDHHGEAETTEPAETESPHKPDALSFLESDSPVVTEEQIRRTIAEAANNWSPRSAWSPSSVDSNGQASAADTYATTPEPSLDGEILSTTFRQRSPPSSEDGHDDTRKPEQTRPAHTRQRRFPSGIDAESRYGTPEMPRGSAKHPHFPPNELQPRLPGRGQGHTKHLPRAEKLPMSGYELLSAKLSNTRGRSRRRSGGAKEMPTAKGEPSIKPIYRRFEALNHRLLLHLQDELSELEEQLHRLDTADTQTRRLQNPELILPASRRAEYMSGGELQWHKTDLLGKIGFKLGQYNHVLTSFAETQHLSRAAMADVEDYRTYLATQNPIAEIETRFLDPAEDLVCLAPDRPPASISDSSSSAMSPAISDDALTPMPRKMSFGLSVPPARPPRNARPPPQPVDRTISLGQSACLAAVAMVLSTIGFPVVTDFLGRMALVLVAGLAVTALQRRLADVGGEQDLHGADTLTVGAMYGVVMATVAAVM